MYNKSLKPICILALPFILAACGQKGALYLASPQPTQVTGKPPATAVTQAKPQPNNPQLAPSGSSNNGNTTSNTQNNLKGINHNLNTQQQPDLSTSSGHQMEDA